MVKTTADFCDFADIVGNNAAKSIKHKILRKNLKKPNSLFFDLSSKDNHTAKLILVNLIRPE